MEIRNWPPGAIKTFEWTSAPTNWRFEMLGNLASVRRGASPRPAGDPRYFGGHIPWFKIGDATRRKGRFISTTEEFVNEEGARCSVRIPAGSLIISNSGVSLGFARITRVEGCIHDGWLLVSDLLNVDRDYLYYCVNLLTPRIRQIADGTTQPNLNTEIGRRLLIPVPPQPEQRAIAKVLTEFDDKIELNEQMNERLEAIARAIFKSWFVDFDPVRAKAEGRQPFGMDAATAALFPNSFQDSALGKIPRGWRMGKIEEFVRLNRDSVNPNEHPGEVFDHFSIPAFDEGRLPNAEKGEQIKSNKFVVPTGAVLLSKLNPRFPRVWLPAKSGTRRSICSTEFLVATPYAFATTNYLYEILSSDGFYADFATLVTGTSGSHQRVKGEFLLEMDSVIPEEQLVAQFSERCKPLLSRVAGNLEESQTLAATRDALLPKLISGDIRVKDADQFLKETGI